MAKRRKPGEPIAFRLPADLDEAVRERALAEGLSMSEMLRSIVSQWAYGSTPSADAGYFQARGVAVAAAHEVLRKVFDQFLPTSYEQALQLVTQRPRSE
jgi:hypothetical protein